MTLKTVEIDTAPPVIAAMMASGHFHTHQDRRWRYSPHGGETVHVSDPTAAFEASESFGAWRVSANREARLFAIGYQDGTSGLYAWPDIWSHVWQLYAPKGEAERNARDWIREFFA
jgi:hypothetical protein